MVNFKWSSMKCNFALKNEGAACELRALVIYRPFQDLLGTILQVLSLIFFENGQIQNPFRTLLETFGKQMTSSKLHCTTGNHSLAVFISQFPGNFIVFFLEPNVISCLNSNGSEITNHYRCRIVVFKRNFGSGWHHLFFLVCICVNIIGYLLFSAKNHFLLQRRPTRKFFGWLEAHDATKHLSDLMNSAHQQ